jgi:hypothetical protein
VSHRLFTIQHDPVHQRTTANCAQASILQAGTELLIHRDYSFRSLALVSFTAIGLFISGCGGGSSTPAPAPGPTTSVSNPVPTPAPTPAPTGGGTTPASPSGVVSVAAGQTLTGVDVNVVAPAVSPPENAEVLGVTDVNSGGTASNSGATIHVGSTMKVLLFGHGLSGNMTVTISGPGDIAVSNIRAISSTTGTAGIAFDAGVSGSAALGARTVYLKSTNGDITTFTGGLEVIP